MNQKLPEMKLGSSGIQCSKLAYGCWRIAGSEGAPKPDTAQQRKGVHAIHTAYETGYTLFDLADIYGGGWCEIIFGQALREEPAMRDKILIATKCGIRKPNTPNPGDAHRYDFSFDYILESCEGSLSRMEVDRIDLFMLHRPDYLMDIHEVAKAFSKLQQAGKVGAFGVSNFTPSQVSLLQSALSTKLLVNQVEIHLLNPERLQDGSLDQCMQNRITPMAWSPLAGGALDLERFDYGSNELLRQRVEALRKLMDPLAHKYRVTWSEIALAWLLKHPAGILPVIGSTNPKRIQMAATSVDFELTREEWYSLLVPALGHGLP